MSEYTDIPSVAEAAALIQEIGGRPPNYGVKRAIEVAARRLGWSYGRARRVWYRDAMVSPEELEALRALAGGGENIEARNEIAALKARIARLERLLDATAPPARRGPLSSLGRLLGRLAG